MNTLTCPLPTFQRLLRALTEEPRQSALVRVGLHHTPPDNQWLVRDLVLSPHDLSPAHQQVFRVIRSAHLPSINPAILDLEAAVCGHLYLGDGPWRAHLRGFVRVADAIEPLHQLSLVGAGMHRIPISDPPDQVHATNGRHTRSDHLRWSRTIGALGGEAVWQRLTQLSVAIIGCGRTGSLVAVSLARLGIRQLTLIDPDLVEIHNLGEMDGIGDADLGRPKAEALADRLRSLLPGVQVSISAVAASIAAPAAFDAAKACDVLFCCADNDAARLATAILATLYHRVLVDIGTGIFYRDSPAEEQTSGRAQQREGLVQSALSPAFSASQQPAPRTMGADVRVILPGDGCLLCRGNLSNYAQAVEDICNHHEPADLQNQWSQHRAGSLRSLNQLAAALGVQMLQDVVSARLESSTWARIEFNEVG